MVAQWLAVRRPPLVRSLVLLSSSSNAETKPSIPRRSPPRSRSVQDRIEAEVEMWRGLVGPDAPFHESYWRDLVVRSLTRTESPDAVWRHRWALERTPPLTAMLPRIQAPTLVIHGRKDHVFPIEHGRVLSRSIPAARLVEVERLAHIFPPQWSPLIGALLLKHFAGARRHQPTGERDDQR
jgi:pimeloyl-ACP methyl ester carboxylesterase